MDMQALSALMGEDVETAIPSDIWVVVLDASAGPMLGEARRLADGLGCYVHAVTSDESLSDSAIALGADKVHVTAEPLAVLFNVRPEFVFLPNSHNPEAAQLAQHFKAGLITNAIELSVDDSTRALIGARMVYGGEYGVSYAISSEIKVATLDPRLLPTPYSDASRSGETLTAEASRDSLVRDLGPTDYTPQAWRPLQKAKVIVSVGRGLKDEEGLALAKELAAKLGAELAGDRSARELGWVEEAREVHFAHERLEPQVYLALGIRGDTAHNLALGRAQRIIAVHANPTASILSLADHAIVAEPKEFVRALLAEL